MNNSSSSLASGAGRPSEAQVKEPRITDQLERVAHGLWARGHEGSAATIRGIAAQLERANGCLCGCCDHGEGSDCGCTCHASGACAFQPLEAHGGVRELREGLAALVEQEGLRLRRLATELRKPGCNVWCAPAAAGFVDAFVDHLSNLVAGEAHAAPNCFDCGWKAEPPTTPSGAEAPSDEQEKDDTNDMDRRRATDSGAAATAGNEMVGRAGMTSSTPSEVGLRALEALMDALTQERDELNRRVGILAAAANDADRRAEYTQGNYLKERSSRMKAEASLCSIRAAVEQIATEMRAKAQLAGDYPRLSQLEVHQWADALSTLVQEQEPYRGADGSQLLLD